jgi:rod shape-determining protein MreD
MLESAIMGIILGIVVDILFAKIIGLNPLFFMYIALFAGGFNKKIYKDSVFPAVFFVGIATIIYNLYLIFIMFVLKDNLIYWNIILKTILIQMLYNMVITFFVHPVILRISEWGQVGSKIVRKY